MIGTPIIPAKATNKRLLQRARAIIWYFNKYARDGYCPGDITSGWDWPTMNVVFPELCQEYRDIVVEWDKRHPKEQGNG